MALVRGRRPDPLMGVLEQCRINRGLTVSEMCRRAGMKPNRWYSYQDGSQCPSLSTLRDMAKAVDLAVVFVPQPGYRSSFVSSKDIHRLEEEFATALQAVQQVGVLLEEVGARLHEKITEKKSQ